MRHLILEPPANQPLIPLIHLAPLRHLTLEPRANQALNSLIHLAHLRHLTLEPPANQPLILLAQLAPLKHLTLEPPTNQPLILLIHLAPLRHFTLAPLTPTPVSAAPNTTGASISNPSTLPGTTVLPSITSISATTVSPTTSTRNPGQPPKRECQNSGKYDGTQCICLQDFFGTFCEFIKDKIELGKTLNVSRKLTVKVKDKDFKEEMKNKTSTTFKDFESEFNKTMAALFNGNREYKYVKINSLKNGSIDVDYDLILEIEYKQNINVSAQYNQLFETVMRKMENYTKNCTTNETNLCFQITSIANASDLSEDAICRERIPLGFQEFYTGVYSDGALVCMSDCYQQSSRYYDCYMGTCQIQNRTGPHCLCPNTDIYIYASEKCRGQMLKSAVYGGVGAAIAVLGVIIVSVGFLLFRSKKHKKKEAFANDQEDNWYNDDIDDEWRNQRGFSTINQGAANGNEGLRRNVCTRTLEHVLIDTHPMTNFDTVPGNCNGSYSSSNNGSFKTTLQNVDTTIKV
ncbi:hypothetical protein XELAEV_18019158mg [Xenopus laevis]|uniref:SEA domain-containing protein n=1 Tax=Xenopus laevis TaxID=8355 RepID=A0A974HUG7_XENLA|nr:hypothetical protein XELAEV_18019158mg [Xenopus laevis]